jgi:Sulfotransferase family
MQAGSCASLPRLQYPSPACKAVRAMTIINHTHKFVFVHVPKAAGTTVANALSKLTRYCDQEVGGTGFGENIQKAYLDRFGLGKHTPYFRLAQIIGHKELSQFYTFSFVRNPFTRATSTYNFLLNWNQLKGEVRSRIEAFGNFEEYVLSDIWNQTDGPDSIFRPQFFWLRNSIEDDTIGVRYVGKVENIESDLRSIIHQIGVEQESIFDPPLRKMNATTPIEPRLLSNPHVVDKIRRRYAVDFLHFGYSSDPDALWSST